MRGIERPCSGTHGCTRSDPHTHRYLSMGDRTDHGGDSLNDRLARAQAQARHPSTTRPPAKGQATGGQQS